VKAIAACLLLGAMAVAQYQAPAVLATLRVPGLDESSGLAASRAYPGVFWSHNDSGGGPFVYAFDRTGKGLGRWRVPAARAVDWEDMAIAPGPKGGWQLYLGDIGNNQRRRKEVTVYRIPEPNPRAPAATTAPAEAIRLQYPDEAHDAECLMAHPKTGDLYIVTKARGRDSETIVFKAAAPLSVKRSNMLRKVAVLDLPDSPLTLVIGRVTGGDISPDGQRVILCGYFSAWEARLPSGAKRFDAIWAAQWEDVGLGSRAQGESVCYRHDGRAVLATSEGTESPLSEVVRAR
jgi:hypothetical protein